MVHAAIEDLGFGDIGLAVCFGVYYLVYCEILSM